MARTMYVVRRGPYQFFADDLIYARIARMLHPELKRGHITNVLQMREDKIKIGRLYKDGEEVQR